MQKSISHYQRLATACLTATLAFALCGGPQMAMAQQSPSTQPTQTPADPQAATTDQQTQATPGQAPATDQTTTPSADQAPQAQSGTPQQPANQQPSRPGMVDPSAGPLTPAPSSNEPQQPGVQPQDLPDAPSATQAQQPAQQETPAQKPKPRTTAPVGVGTAQQAPTAGGAASKPAGAAIAPAKQKQYRSLLIKIGAIAGAGAALGTVYALSRGTNSKPPGAR